MKNNLTKKQQAALPENLQIAANTDRTRGEKFFDFFTYKVVNFGANEILSLGIVDLFLGGSKEVAGDKPTSFFANKIGGKAIGFSDNLRKLQDKLDATPMIGKTGGGVFTLNLGGHVMAGLVKLLENNRTGLTQRFDKIIDTLTGKKADTNEIARRQARYEILRNTPTKTGWQVAKGRLSGMVASMVINQLPETIDAKIGKETTAGHRGFRRMTAYAGQKAEPLAGSLAKLFGAEAHGEMGGKRLKYWSEMALFETWCTAVTSHVMETVIKWGDDKQPVEQPAAIPTSKSQAETDNITAPQEGRASNPLAEASTSRFYDDEPEGEKRWADKRQYDHVDEVGIHL